MGCAASFSKMLGPIAMSMEKVEHQKNTLDKHKKKHDARH